MNYCETQIIEMPEMEIIESDLSLDETNCKNKELIRLDLNIIQYPIFCKNTNKKTNKIMRYDFNKNRNNYIIITPQPGDSVPAETEEKLLIGIMSLMKEKGYKSSFIVTTQELKEAANIPDIKCASVIKKGLSRMCGASYKFSNTLYSSETKSVLKNIVQTNILNYRVIKLDQSENKNYRDEYNDKRVKEIYEISMSEIFYKNIISSGYLVFDAHTLLGMESSTTRTMYMIIEKLRFNKPILLVDAIYLIKRIPLTFNKQYLTRTIGILKKSLEELKNKNLIENYRFIKNKTWEKSEIEIKFPIEMLANKQKRFYKDKDDYVKLATQECGEVIQKPVIPNNNKVTLEQIETIFGILSKNKLKTTLSLQETKALINKFGYDKVESAVKKIKNKDVDNLKKSIIEVINCTGTKKMQTGTPVVKIDGFCEDAEFVVSEENKNRVYKVYEKATPIIQTEIEERTYSRYVEECGGADTKIQKLAFRAAKKSLITKYLIYNEYYLDEYYSDEFERLAKEIEKTISREESIMTDTDEVVQAIKFEAEFNKMMFSLNEEQTMEQEHHIGYLIIRRFNEGRLYRKVIRCAREIRARKLDILKKVGKGF